MDVPPVLALALFAALAVLAGAVGGALATRFVTTSALRARHAEDVRRRALRAVANQRLKLIRSAQYSTDQASLTGPAARLRFAEAVLADVDDLPRWQAARVREQVARLVGRGWAEAAITLGSSPLGSDAVRSHYEIQLYLRDTTRQPDGDDQGAIGRLHEASAVESDQVARRGAFVSEAVRLVDDLGATLRRTSRWRRPRR